MIPKKGDILEYKSATIHTVLLCIKEDGGFVTVKCIHSSGLDNYWRVGETSDFHHSSFRSFKPGKKFILKKILDETA